MSDEPNGLQPPTQGSARGTDALSPQSGFSVAEPDTASFADRAAIDAEQEVTERIGRSVEKESVTGIRPKGDLRVRKAHTTDGETAPVALSDTVLCREYAISDYLLMFDLAVRVGASDLHLVPNEVPMLRHNLELKFYAESSFRARCSPRSLRVFFEYLAGRSQNPVILSNFDEVGWVDLSFVHDESPVRGNAFRQRGGVALALRFLYRKFTNLSFLELEQILAPHLRKPSGLILVTGPTGSGKTTTAVAMIEWLNATFAYHIATIEDPVEYIIRENRSRITMRSVPLDVTDFESGLKAVLRQDPDVIFLGEMRDLPVMRKTLQAAETGHVVISTMHADSVVLCFQRLVLSFPVEEQQFIRETLASLPIVVVNQRLVSGPKGMVLAYEVFHHTHATQSSLRVSDLTGWPHAMATTPSMKLWNNRLKELLAAGRITQAGFNELFRDDSVRH